MKISDKVRIKAPFREAFPGEYTITEIDEDMTLVKLEGEESAFDFIYLEAIDA